MRSCEALAAELLQVAQGDMRTSRVDVERAAVEVARAVATGGPRAPRPDFARRSPPFGGSMTHDARAGMLDALADGAVGRSRARRRPDPRRTSASAPIGTYGFARRPGVRSTLPADGFTGPVQAVAVPPDHASSTRRPDQSRIARVSCRCPPDTLGS